MVKSANNKVDYLDMLLYPLRGTALGAIIGLTLVATLALATFKTVFGIFLFIFGIILLLLNLLAMMQYSFKMAVSSSMGHYEPPAMGADDFVSFSNMQPLQLLAAFILIAILIRTVSAATHPYVGIVLLMTLTLALPAIIGTLAVTRSIFDAINPALIARMIAAVGKHYWVLILWLFASILLVDVIQEKVSSIPIALALSIYTVFLTFHASGRLMFTHRDELGLNVLSPAELRAEEDERNEQVALSNQLEAVHQKARVEPKLAAQDLTDYCNENDLGLEKMEWMFSHLQSWPDSTTALWFSRPLIARLVKEKRGEAAVKIATWCIQKEPAFRPEQADVTWNLSQIALSSNQTKLGVILLHDFAKRYPEHKNATPALFAVGRIALERQNDPQLAKLMLAQLLQRGIDPNDPRMQALSNAGQPPPTMH